MRKFFYGISVFVFLCVLSLAYYGTYKAAEIQRRDFQAGRNQKLEQAKLENTAQVSEAASTQGGYGMYFLKEKEGYVAVYEGDKTTLFEPTNILVSTLPETLKQEIRQGKYLKSEAELYSFLENYSS